MKVIKMPIQKGNTYRLSTSKEIDLVVRYQMADGWPEKRTEEDFLSMKNVKIEDFTENGLETYNYFKESFFSTIELPEYKIVAVLHFQEEGEENEYVQFLSSYVILKDEKVIDITGWDSIEKNINELIERDREINY